MSARLLRPSFGLSQPRLRCSRCLGKAALVIPAVRLSLPWQCISRYLETRERFPHLANAFKYCFALVIVVLGSTHKQWSELGNGQDLFGIIWISAFVISTLYTFSWDILVDWELQHRLTIDGRRM